MNKFIVKQVFNLLRNRFIRPVPDLLLRSWLLIISDVLQEVITVLIDTNKNDKEQLREIYKRYKKRLLNT